MALVVGKYENVSISQTSIEKLVPLINGKGTLSVMEDNKVNFEHSNGCVSLEAIQWMGDFSVISITDVWIGTTDGDITFTRPNQNALWEREKGDFVFT